MFSKRKRPALVCLSGEKTCDSVRGQHTDTVSISQTSPSCGTLASLEEKEVEECAQARIEDVLSVLKEEKLPPPPQTQLLRNDVCSSIAVPKRHAFSGALKYGGNARAWETVKARISLSHTILLHGPCGCGKSEGVKDLCENSLGRTVFTIDPSFENDAEDLVKEIQRACQPKTLLETVPSLLLIDDIDGFNSRFLSIILQFVLKKKNADIPVILTCTDPYIRELKPLTSIERIRLYEPSRKSSLYILKASFPSATQSKVDAYYPQTGGNLHKLKVMYSCIFQSRPDVHKNMFDGTHSLLRDGDTDAWTRSGEEQSLVRILSENILLFTGAGEDAFVDACHALSEYDIRRGEERIEILGKEMHTCFKHSATESLVLPKRQITYSLLKKNSYDIPEPLQAYQQQNAS